MTTIAKGGNLPIDAAAVRAQLSWGSGPAVPDVDGSALLLRADGRVASDDDFVFFNQPRHPSGTVRHAGKAGTTTRSRSTWPRCRPTSTGSCSPPRPTAGRSARCRACGS